MPLGLSMAQNPGLKGKNKFCTTCSLSTFMSTYQKSGRGHPWHQERTIKAWEESSLGSARAKQPLRGSLQPPALPARQPCLWLTCDILVFTDREAELLMVIDIRKCHVWICQPDLPPPLRFLPPGPQFILILQWKLSSMEWLPAVSHKPLIVLWAWIVAFYHPAMVKGTFVTGVGHGIFSWNANGFQDPFFFYARHLWFHLCVQISSLIPFLTLLIILLNSPTYSLYWWILIS